MLDVLVCSLFAERFLQLCGKYSPHALCIIYIHAYFGKFSIIDMFQKFWPWAKFSRPRSKIKGKVIFGAVFHKLKYETSLKSL